MKQGAIQICLVAVVLAATGGCVRESTEGTTRVFNYELWISLSIALAGLVAAPAGWYLRTATARFGYGLMIIGPLAALFFAPTLYLDRATVSDEEFSVRSGIWGMTSVHDVKYADLKQIRFVSEESRGRRGRKRTDYFLLCERTDGTSAKVPINNDLTEAAAPHFLKEAATRGIPIVNETKP